MDENKKPGGEEPLFAFKGHDIRSGKKEEIPVVPAAQPQKLTEAVEVIIPPKLSTPNTTLIEPVPPRPQVQTVPNPIPKPVIKPVVKPVPTPPVIKTISTATAPNAPSHVGEEGLRPLRTYEGDVAEVLAHKRTSTASIAIAESQKNTGEDKIGESDEHSHVGKKIAITVISLILIATGLVGAYYLYSISPLAPTPRSTPQPQVAPSIVTSDSQVAIPIDNMRPNDIIAAVRKEIAKQQTANTIKEIILVETKNSQHFRVAGQDMANIMDTGAPDILARSLSDSWMLGEYADANGVKTVFVIASIDYFQNAFAGMLQWESTMADDLKQYLYASSPADIALGSLVEPTLLATAASGTSALATTSTSTTSTTIASSTATSTSVPPAITNQPYVVLRGSFIDRIIGNKDVREFVTSDGKALFLYSFIDNTHLVITGSEATLSAILNRLEQQAFVR